MTAAIDGLKTCCRCKAIKPIAAYNKRANTKDGLMHYCRECQKAASQLQYRKDPDKHKKRMRSWQLQNPEARRIIERRCYAGNKVVMVSRHTDHNRKRRAAKYGNGPIDDITLQEVFERDKGICQICKTVCTYEQSSIDHCIALINGGTHTWDNVQLAHRTCNSSKGAR